MIESNLMKQVAGLMIDAGASYREAEDMHRAAFFRAALERTGGNICRAAKLVRSHRNHFTRQLEILNMRDLPEQLREQRRQAAMEQPHLWRKQPTSSGETRRNNSAA